LYGEIINSWLGATLNGPLLFFLA